MMQDWGAIAEPAVHAMAAAEMPRRPADRLRAMETAYVELRRTARAAGLLERRHGYYLWRGGVSFALLLGSLALALTAPPTVGWTVLASVLIGFGSVQVGLIGHDAGHRAVFADKRANWALGRCAGACRSASASGTGPTGTIATMPTPMTPGRTPSSPAAA